MCGLQSLWHMGSVIAASRAQSTDSMVMVSNVSQISFISYFPLIIKIPSYLKLFSRRATFTLGHTGVAMSVKSGGGRSLETNNPKAIVPPAASGF